MSETRTFKPSGPLRGRVSVPSDKSITQRALVIGAVSDGVATIRDPLWAGDTEATAAMLGQLGVRVEREGADGRLVRLHGVGRRGLRPPARPLDAHNSGTAMRLLAGLLAGQEGTFVIDGDESLRSRPMDRVAVPLRAMGVRIEAREGRYAPLTIRGGEVDPIEYELPVASAQVKSCVLLAGLHATGTTTVVEPVPSRDHTERMLAGAGVPIERRGRRVWVTGPAQPHLDEVAIPGDVSSAAFLVAAATIVKGSDLRLTGVGLNPTRTGFFEVIRRMGGALEWEVEADDGGEPRGAVHARTAALQAATVAADEVPLLVDELPLVALLGAFADGETRVAGAGELRFKESDRLAATGTLLRNLGADIELTEDGFVVHGSGCVCGGIVRSLGDHRLALLGAVAGLASRAGVVVEGFDAAAVSFPSFEDVLREALSS
jgi:3-phosphoshikimate 1-carboxyvinyltransferase